MAERHRATMDAMDRLERDIAASGIDVLVIIGDDQREMFKDAFRPAIAIYYGDTIRNAAAPEEPAADWYLQDQRKRMEEKEDRHYPCHPALATALIKGLMARDFDITAMKSLAGDQFEGHAYSFIHRRFMPKGPIPIVPVILNTYYPPNQPSPRRCFDLGVAIRELVEAYPENIRVGILASGGLSHFLVNEALDREVVNALQKKDYPALQGTSAQQACQRFIRDQKLDRDGRRRAAPEPRLDHLCSGLPVARAHRRGPLFRALAVRSWARGCERVAGD